MATEPLITTLANLGNTLDDTRAEKQKKSFLIYMGLIMGAGGLVWGIISFYHALYIPSLIPFGYTLVTAGNFLYFSKTKNYRVAKTVQVLLSLVLPFVFQWILGGFASTGAVMLWAVLPLIGSLSFEQTQASRIWMIVFLVLAIVSAVIDPWVKDYAIHISAGVQALFFGINLLAVSATVYALTVYFIDVRDEALSELKDRHQEVQQSQSQLIQSEKMAVLGRLIAGVAHEVNTPLGAITASISNVRASMADTVKTLPELLAALPEELKPAFHALTAEVMLEKVVLSGKEEREHKKLLTKTLEQQDIADAREKAGLLVDCGITTLTDELKPLIQSDHALSALEVAYSLYQQFQNANNINLATEKASKVIFALKSYSHVDKDEDARKANICDSIEHVLTLYHNQLKRGIEVVKEFEEVPEIKCRVDELNQVWTNLLHNAMQAMKGRGKLIIRVMNTGTTLKVSFTDNGPGIPEAIIDQIFEPFFTTKPMGEGSGLGLDIVQKMVQKHNGTIRVKSVRGNTTFTVRLPLIQP